MKKLFLLLFLASPAPLFALTFDSGSSGVTNSVSFTSGTFTGATITDLHVSTIVLNSTTIQGSTTSGTFSIPSAGTPATGNFVLTTATQTISAPLLNIGQPSFAATGNGTTQTDCTGDGTGVTVEYKTEVYDQTSSFSGSTFTAPITGRYHLCASAFLAQIGAGHTQRNMAIVTSNRVYDQIYNMTLAEATREMNLCVDADMDIGDTAYVTVAIDASTKTVDINGAATATKFSGFLAN